MTRPSRRRACLRCGDLKVKCVFPAQSTTCARCARLSQSCLLATPPKPKAATVKKDRIDLLQEQINNLAAELHRKNRVDEPPGPRPTIQSPESPTSTSSSQPCFSTPEGVIHAQHGAGSHDVFSRGILTISAGEELLARYRETKMPLFPFVVFPPTMDLFSLRLQYPFLLLTILAASAENNLPLQRKLETEIRVVICNRFVMADERNLDLLQGLLIHIAWHHYHFDTVRRQLYVVLQMAMAIIVDLALDRDHNFGIRDIAVEVRGQEDEDAATKHLTFVEKRSLLGCYYLYSISSLFRKQLYMRHTGWIDRCCLDLSTTPEYPSDVHLKIYIEIQILARRSEELISSQDAVLKDPSSDAAWKTQFDILKAQSKRIAEEAISGGLEVPLTLSRDLEAIPIYLYRPFVHRKNPVLALNHTDQIIQDLFSCAIKCLNSHLATSPDVFIHLPQTAHTITWYGLLLATKVALCSSNSGVSGDREMKIVYDLAVKNNDLHGTLSTGDDVWAISQRAIGFVIAWLEKYEAQGLRPQKGGGANTLPPGGTPKVKNTDRLGCEVTSWQDPNTSSIVQSGTEAMEPLGGQFTNTMDEMYWDEVMRSMLMEDFTIMPNAFPPSGGGEPTSSQTDTSARNSTWWLWSNYP